MSRGGWIVGCHDFLIVIRERSDYHIDVLQVDIKQPIFDVQKQLNDVKLIVAS
jgi:hypothetical protein